MLGGDEDVLGVAGSGLRSLGYSTYFGNRGMVVGSDQDATLATPFALVGGVVAMPLFFATWPIVVALAEPGSRDGPAWWPVVPLRPWINSFDRHTIYVSLGPSEIGLITVIARATGPEPRRSRDLEALWEFLGSHFELTVEAPEIDGRTLAPR